MNLKGARDLVGSCFVLLGAKILGWRKSSLEEPDEPEEDEPTFFGPVVKFSDKATTMIREGIPVPPSVEEEVHTPLKGSREARRRELGGQG